MDSTNRNNPRKIPGYYFDREKKTYFKIPSKTDRSTYDIMSHTKLNGYKKRNKSSSKGTKAKMTLTKSMDLIRTRQCGIIDGIDYCREIEKWRWQQTPTQVISLANCRQLYPDKVEALCLSQDGKYLIRKNFDATNYPHQSNFGMYSVSIEKGSKPEINFAKIVRFTSTLTYFSGCDWTEINGNQWALFAFKRNGPFNSDSSTLLAYQLKQPIDISDSDVQIVKRPWVMEESPWSISANTSPCNRCGHFGIGGETRQHMYDVEMKMRYSYSTNRVTVLSQSFCRQSPYLVSGLRNGKALIWDLRNFPGAPANVMQSKNKQHLSPIIWLQPIINDTYIIVQKLNGELALWDTRTYKRCVIYNHSTPDSTLDLIGHRAFLSESERSLIGFPNSNGKPMFYDVISGEVIKNKFDRSNISDTAIPNSRFCYGSNWGGGVNGIEGILESTPLESWRFFHI